MGRAWVKAIAAMLSLCLLAGCQAQTIQETVQIPSNSVHWEPLPTVTEPSVTGPKPSQTEPETEPETEPAVPLPLVQKITMTFVGDCTLGRNQESQYWNSFDEYYDNYGPDYFLQDVRHIFEADDLTVINLEGPLTTSEDIQERTWHHKGDPKYVQIIADASVEVATMGNNHRLDYGEAGSDETVQVLQQAGIAHCFDGNYAMCTVDGVKIGIVSVNALKGWGAVKPWLEDGLRYLRDQGCAIVVACAHWGGDKVTELEEWQFLMGEWIIDMGYDLVIGHHPHVLQAVRVYKGKFICYSLGNFCYGGSKRPADTDSGIFQKTFTLVDGVLVPDLEARFLPCLFAGQVGKNDFRPRVASGEDYGRILDKINGYSKIFGVRFDEAGEAQYDG